MLTRFFNAYRFHSYPTYRGKDKYRSQYAMNLRLAKQAANNARLLKTVRSALASTKSGRAYLAKMEG